MASASNGPDAPITTEPSRKISIKTYDGGHDNPVFESPRRKVSMNEQAEISSGPIRKKSVLHGNNEVVSYAEMGPVRKKSILHNAGESSISENNRQVNGDPRFKKHSTTSSVYSRKSIASDIADDKSWWFLICMKCRSKEELPSWQPPLWHRICPHPFCPSYRQVSRIIALTLIGLLLWGVVYAIVGEMAAPGGQLFGLAFLAIAAHFGGWIVSLTTLPGLIGMLVIGLIFQNTGLVDLGGDFGQVTSHLRKIALVIILTRAGLDLDPKALRNLKLTVLKLGLGPWIIEAAVLTVSSHYLLGIPWNWGVLLGSIIAAIAPAVVVPCLFRLRGKGYGVAKGIPTLIIAVSGIDDATSVAIFGIVESIMFSHDSLTYQIIQGPLSIIGGLVFGIIWGIITRYVPEKHDPFVVPLRVLMLLLGGLIAVFGSEALGFSGAGPLGCITAAFVSLVCWTGQGWEIEDNPVATAFEIFWMIFEPILFGLTGASITLKELDPTIVTYGIACLGTAIIIRIIGTVLLGVGCNLNLKEKIFVAISWLAKATVQAALGPVALQRVGNSEPENEYANKVLMVCVLSILMTAPFGAFLITILGPRLLTKTSIPQVAEGWRRSHRPSIRDISIIEEERHDEERTQEEPPKPTN